MVRIEKTPCDGSGGAAGRPLRIAVVRARFNDLVTRRLLDGALEALHEHGVTEEQTLVIEVPGAVELALAAKLAIDHQGVDAVVCLGAVIRGETDHYDYVCRIAADSLSRLAVESGVPVAFGVLTCDKLEQALARSGSGSGNRGHDAALVALEMANLERRLTVPLFPSKES